MHVLIVEPTYLGHRLNHVGTLARAVLALPAAVRLTIATSPGGPASAQFQTWVAPAIAGRDVEICTPFVEAGDGFDRGWIAQQTTRIAALARDVAADHVLIPSADGVVQLAAILRYAGRFPRRRGVEFEAMMLRGKFAYRRPTSLRDRLDDASWFALVRHSPMVRVHHMDPLIYEAAIRRQPSLAGKLCSIPDPVDPIEPDLTPAEARAKLGLPTDGRMFGCVGGLQLRKGIDLLIRSFARGLAAGRLRGDDRLLLVGTPEAAVDAILDGEARPLVESGRIVAIRRFVDDVAMSNALSAMNLVVTAYPGHVGSASITLRAAAQRRPVLADRAGWCGRIVPQFALGTVVDVSNASAFDDALVAALDASPGFVPDPRADVLVRYIATPNFVAHWMARLRERLALPPEPTLTWDAATASRD